MVYAEYVFQAGVQLFLKITMIMMMIIMNKIKKTLRKERKFRIRTFLYSTALSCFFCVCQEKLQLLNGIFTKTSFLGGGVWGGNTTTPPPPPLRNPLAWSSTACRSASKFSTGCSNKKGSRHWYH